MEHQVKLSIYAVVIIYCDVEEKGLVEGEEDTGGTGKNNFNLINTRFCYVMH